MTEAIALAPCVRPAGLADAAILAGLHATSFERSWPASEMTQFLSGPGCLVLLASQAEAPKGMIIVRGTGDEAEILTLAVSPDSRRSGLARALLTAAIEALRSAGVRSLFLEVDESNRAAQSLYRSFGGMEAGIRRRYYESGANAVIFSLAL